MTDAEKAQHCDPDANVYFRTDKMRQPDDGVRSECAKEGLTDDEIDCADSAIAEMCTILDCASATLTDGTTMLFSETGIRSLLENAPTKEKAEMYAFLRFSLQGTLECMIGYGFLEHLHRGDLPKYDLLTFDTSETAVDIAKMLEDMRPSLDDFAKRFLVPK